MSIAQKIKVLIVDDQVTSRLLLGDALQQLGFTQITVAGDGEQGAKIIISTIHKFSTDQMSVLKNEAQRRFAILIDEAHSSQSGKHADSMARVQPRPWSIAAAMRGLPMPRP